MKEEIEKLLGVHESQPQSSFEGAPFPGEGNFFFQTLWVVGICAGVAFLCAMCS